MSEILIDTHAMLWFFWSDPRLSPVARRMIEDPDNRKRVSLASSWEIAIKVGRKKLELGDSTRAFLEREIRRNNFDLLPISFEHATSVQDLEPHHRDPFDRLLVAQAICEGLPIVSGDAIFDRYGVARLW